MAEGFYMQQDPRPGKRGLLDSLAVLVPFAALTLVTASCGDGTGPALPAEITELPRNLSVAEIEVLRAANDFGLELLRRLHADRGEDEANVFISPLSASMALAMAMNGADGETFDAMRDVLGFEGLTLERINEAYGDLTDLLLGLDPAVNFRLANSAWLQEAYPILAEYRARVEEAFDARVENVNFRDPTTAEVINDWVEENTEGRIRDFVTAEEIWSTITLLVNTVYFEGQWTDRFDPAETAPADFRRPDGSTVSVPMMRQSLWAKFTAGEGFVAVDLPYGAKAFSMTVVVPTGDATLDALVQGMDGARWQEIVDGLGEGHGEVWLPRFELTYTKLLNNALIAMGMEIAFDPARADFGRLVENAGPGTGPSIGWVKQKSFVKVDEEGTVAAAATGVAFVISRTLIQADRPFLFAIRERFSGTILFVGTVTDPTAG